MPRGGSKPGERRGGRQKGTPNASTQTIKERLQQLGCDYVGYLALTANNQVPCSVCRGKGKTKFQPAHSERFEGIRTCQSCWGSGLERLKPSESAWAAAELMSYCEAKRKAIEHSNPDGSLRPSWVVQKRSLPDAPDPD